MLGVPLSGAKEGMANVVCYIYQTQKHRRSRWDLKHLKWTLTVCFKCLTYDNRFISVVARRPFNLYWQCLYWRQCSWLMSFYSKCIQLIRSLASATSSSEYPTFLLIDTWVTMWFLVQLRKILASCRSFRSFTFFIYAKTLPVEATYPELSALKEQLTSWTCCFLSWHKQMKPGPLLCPLPGTSLDLSLHI